MKKKLLIILAVVVILAVPVSVFAATSDTPAAKTVRGFFDFSKLTDQQKADVKDFSQKMADLQKDFINKMVSNGAMTKEEGDAAIKRIDDMQKNGEYGMVPGFGMGRKGFGPGRDGMGIGNIDTSKLTDQQKADLLATYKKMADLQKDVVDKMVAGSLLTRDQGDTSKAEIDEAYKSLQDNGFTGKGILMGRFGGFDCFGLRGIDQSKLTDQLKTDLKDYSAKQAELQKEVINKLVSFGTLTKEQGDNASAKIDEMQKIQQENGFPGGFGGRMGKGHMGGHGMRGNFKNNVTTPADSVSSANAPTT